MLSRFTKTRNPHPDDRLRAGTQIVPIQCWGTIEITIRTPTGLQSMTLLDVAYVPDFMTNIVSQDKLYTKGLYFDNWKMHLHREGQTVGLVERHNGHYLLENNMTSTPHASTLHGSFAVTKTRSMEDRHQLLGHASHVDMPAEGVKVVDDLDPVSQITEIESDSEDELETPAPIQVKAPPPLSPTPNLAEIPLSLSPTPSPADIPLLSSPDTEISELSSSIFKSPTPQQYSDTCR